MRVTTKYGDGTLIAVSEHDKKLCYIVLLDANLLPEPVSVSSRLYNCRSIEVISIEGTTIQFNEDSIKIGQ